MIKCLILTVVLVFLLFLFIAYKKVQVGTLIGGNRYKNTIKRL